MALLGFGLIGGSIARAIQAGGSQAAADWVLTAWSPTGDGPRRAVADGSIAEAASTAGEAVAGADLIVLAAPPRACLALIDELAGPLRSELADDVVVTDVASTKVLIVEHAQSRGLRFVGGHPMAGLESTGYGSADGELFRDRPWVVVPAGDPEAEAQVEALAVACGARPVRLAADVHDDAVAGISHLPLVVAAALVEAVSGGAAARADWPATAGLAAGGWRDMTRLARGDVAMGTDIALTNAPAIARRLRDLRAALDGWLADLEAPAGPEAARLEGRLRAARERLEETS